jgi:hypothetical protein
MVEHSYQLEGVCQACPGKAGCLYAGREIRRGAGISSVAGMEAMNEEVFGSTHADAYVRAADEGKGLSQVEIKSAKLAFDAGVAFAQRALTTSVLQAWVMELPLREQGTLLTAVRGCDDEAKQWSKTGVAYSPGRRLTAFIRFCFMNPADPREVDYEEGAFFRSEPPTPFKPSEFGHLPLHWYSHAMHALEIVGYRHPDLMIRGTAAALYHYMVRGLHLNVETREQMIERLSEDRIVSGAVVS